MDKLFVQTFEWTYFDVFSMLLLYSYQFSRNHSSYGCATQHVIDGCLTEIDADQIFSPVIYFDKWYKPIGDDLNTISKLTIIGFR